MDHSKLTRNDVMQQKKLYSSSIATPLGMMVALADDAGLYLLAFADRPDLTAAIARIQKQEHGILCSEQSPILIALASELEHYFAGTLTAFTIPLHMHGSSFQENVWQTLQKIPYGTTQSYASIAHTIDKPTAFRAVARANSTNRLAIIIPCHRIINANGSLSGYNGGIMRKKWLIDHEKKLNTIKL